ncbi:hypothetical protein D3C76_387320 [compost metagenome]
MQIENRQTRVAAFSFSGREKTAAVGEREQVADLGFLPGAIGHSCGEHLVEEKTARGREQARTNIALLRQRLARRPRTRINNIAAVVAETLGAEIIGDALLGYQLQTLLNRCFVAIELSQTQGETVGRMRTALQFAFVASGLENLQRVVFRRRQIRIGLARQLHAEPLASQRLTILETGIADGAQRHAGSLGDTPRGFFSVQAAFFDPDPQMFAIAAERNIEDFIDLKVFSDGFQYRRAEGFTIGTRAEQLQFIHARSNKATECTAMPSSRPTKPSFSVVVAFTFT